MTQKASGKDKPFDAMGGYFGLELPDHGDPFPHLIEFQSGRAALRAAIESAGVKRLLLPAYICDTVIQAVVDAGATFGTYCLDEKLYPQELPDGFYNDEALLYVNYFGLSQGNVSRLLGTVPRQHLIIDNCQALFAP